MSKKLKTVMAVIALAAFVFILVISFFPRNAYAANSAQLQEKLKQAQKDKQDAQQHLNSIKSDKSSVETEKQKVDRQMAEVEGEIESISRDIAKVEEKISAKQAELDEAERKLHEYSDTYKNRIRVMYESNNISYLEIIFGAKDFSDLLYRIELVDQVVKHDKEILSVLDNTRKEIDDAKKVIEGQKDELEVHKQIQKQKADQLESVRQSKQEILNALTQDEAKYKKILDEADAAEESLRREIQSITSSSSGTSKVYYTGGRFAWPAPSSSNITSPFGTRFHPIQKRYKTHTGIDIGAGYGTPIVAAEAGKVIRAGWNSGYGNCIVIDHGNGLTTLYGHASSISVGVGTVVSRGQQIGKVGSTGNSTGPHLHFEVLIYGKYTDPMAYFG